MGVIGTLQRKTEGFTIVELILVIVIIGVLVTIVILAYPGYQQRARDSERQSDMRQLSAALSAYALQKNNYVGSASGCGVSGNGNGWINAGPSDLAIYTRPIVSCLQDANVLAAGVFMDPLGCIYDSGGKCGIYRTTPAQAYMKATCTKNSNSVTYVFTHLEGSPRKDSEVDALCDSGSVSGFDTTGQLWGTNYGMNYYLTIK